MKYTEELDKVSYCFGLSIASNLLSSGVNTINTEAFVDAIRTVYAGQMPEIKPEEANQILQDYFNKLQNERGKAAKEAGSKSRVVQYAPEAAQAGYAALCRNGALALSLLIPCRTPAAPAGIMKKSDLNEAVAMLKLIAEKC